MSVRSLFFSAILFSALFYVVYLLLRGLQLKKENNRIESVFKEIENKYSDFIEKYITKQILENNNLDFDVPILVKEVMTVIKPEIEILISVLKIKKIACDKLSFQSVVFNNVISICETLCTDIKGDKTNFIGLANEQEIYNAFEDAILADIKKRTLELNTGF